MTFARDWIREGISHTEDEMRPAYELSETTASGPHDSVSAANVRTFCFLRQDLRDRPGRGNPNMRREPPPSPKLPARRYARRTDNLRATFRTGTWRAED